MDSKKLQLAEEMLGIDQYHTPRICVKCGGVMIFKGVGEYRCEDCNQLAYDDYGKVRVYLEKHKGATAIEIETMTGVKQKTIRMMLKEARFELTDDSRTFLFCDNCGKKIRSGRLCQGCEMDMHRKLEEQQRKKRNEKIMIQGYGKMHGEDGKKRFDHGKMEERK